MVIFVKTPNTTAADACCSFKSVKNFDNTKMKAKDKFNKKINLPQIPLEFSSTPIVSLPKPPPITLPLIPLNKVLNYLSVNDLLTRANLVCTAWRNEQLFLCRIRRRLTILVGSEAVWNIYREVNRNMPTLRNQSIHFSRLSPDIVHHLMQTFGCIHHLIIIYEYPPGHLDFEAVSNILSSDWRSQITRLSLFFNRPPLNDGAPQVRSALSRMVSRINRLGGLRYLYIKYLSEIFPGEVHLTQAYLPVLRHLKELELDTRDSVNALVGSLVRFAERNSHLKRLALFNWLVNRSSLQTLARLAPKVMRRITKLKILPTSEWPEFNCLGKANFCSLTWLMVDLTMVDLTLGDLAQGLNRSTKLRCLTLMMNADRYVRANRDVTLNTESIAALKSVSIFNLALSAHKQADHSVLDTDCILLSFKSMFPNLCQLVFCCKQCTVCNYISDHYFDNRAPADKIAVVQDCGHRMIKPLERIFKDAQIRLKSLVPVVHSQQDKE